MSLPPQGAGLSKEPMSSSPTPERTSNTAVSTRKEPRPRPVLVFLGHVPTAPRPLPQPLEAATTLRNLRPSRPPPRAVRPSTPARPLQRPRHRRHRRLDFPPPRTMPLTPPASPHPLRQSRPRRQHLLRSFRPTSASERVARTLSRLLDVTSAWSDDQRTNDSCDAESTATSRPSSSRYDRFSIWRGAGEEVLVSGRC